MKLSAINYQLSVCQPRRVRLTEPRRRAAWASTGLPKGGTLGQIDVEAALRREFCSVGVSPAVAGASCPRFPGGSGTLRRQRAGRPRYGSWHGHPGHDRARARCPWHGWANAGLTLASRTGSNER